MHLRSAWLLPGVTIVIFVVLFYWLGRPPPHRPDAPAPEPARKITTASPTATSTLAPSKSIDPQRTTALTPNADGLVIWPGAAAAASTLHQPDQSARDDIGLIQTMLSDYHQVFDEVPEGGLNQEIVRGLTGDNPKKIVFLTARQGTLNAEGELLDRWRTPYFFHKLSRDRIDLRSAGPDRKFYTPDDVFEESPGAPPL